MKALSVTQKATLLQAGMSNSGRIYAADYPSSAVIQSAFHRTCHSLVRVGLLKQSYYSNGERMNAYELAGAKAWHVREHIKTNTEINKRCLDCNLLGLV